MPIAPFNLTLYDQLILHGGCRASTLIKRLVHRVSLHFLGNACETVQGISSLLQVNTQMVFKWRKRYSVHDFKGFYDSPRLSQHRKLNRGDVKIYEHTVHQVPIQALHWSISLTRTCWGGVLASASAEECVKFEAATAHYVKITNNPYFFENVCGIVGLYLNALVLSVDEKTQFQTFDRTHPNLQLKPGQVERHTYDYEQHSTTSLYADLNILTDEVIGRVTQRHHALEFLDVLRQIDWEAPQDLQLYVILDSNSSHNTSEVKAWLAKNPRFKVHFTPTSASWLNEVDKWFGQLDRRELYRGNLTSVGESKSGIKKCIKVHNEKLANPFRWNKTTAHDCIIGMGKFALNR
ncbi:IS630 family transposase [Marinobacter vinifirmus]|uniref:IS630 family transposase n=1 Tax=Marinobacter vinifirmus TaxID=355591 RepID=A0A7Z1DRI4_9GAMM|nr:MULTISPECIES: IS630 family transposase [Marinobacter]MAO12230.1 IS630 family transposase [Marinobacter sp.]OZC34678.1 IS630 family transposase [Marinobacter vinifirmus]